MFYCFTSLFFFLFLLLNLFFSFSSCQQTTKGNIISGLDDFGTILVQDSVCGVVVNVTITDSTSFTSQGSELDIGYYAAITGTGSCDSTTNRAASIILSPTTITLSPTVSTTESFVLSGNISSGLTEDGSFTISSKKCGISTIFIDGNTIFNSNWQSFNTSFFIAGIFKGTCSQSLALNITISPMSIAVIPGDRIEVENFDIGGQNIAYYDTTVGNAGGEYRLKEWVDIQSTSDVNGGYNIGWSAQSEWMNYHVAVLTTGVYDLIIRVASDVSTAAFHFSINGSPITNITKVPNTKGWQVWTNVQITGINLSAGVHVLQFDIDGDLGNYNWFQFGSVGSFSNLDSFDYLNNDDSLGSGTTTVPGGGHKNQFAWYFICVITVACVVALLGVIIVVFWVVRRNRLSTQSNNYKELDSRTVDKRRSKILERDSLHSQL